MTLARVPTPRESGVVHHHHRRRVGAWRGPITGVLAALVVVIAGLGGYALGASGRHSDKDAAKARRAAEQDAYARGRRELVARARSDGAAAGQVAGTAAGTRAGKGGLPAPRAQAATTPTGGVKDCKTTIRKKTFVSSVRNITCGAAAAEQGQALRAGHPTSTKNGFTCQRIDPQHYRCTKGSQAYRWDISP